MSFFRRGEVGPSEKQGFGSSALTVPGRIFAMLARGRLGVKLPKNRVDALVEGAGLAEEALAFVGGRDGAGTGAYSEKNSPMGSPPVESASTGASLQL